MANENKTTQTGKQYVTRERNGQYVTRERNGQYADGLDRVCRHCGATKGGHDAERPWAQNDLSMGPECDGFKAVSK